jgi:uncharacterized DUF497 family protein
MELEWDASKAGANLKKHGVDFADAATVLLDPHAITIQDDRAEEERFITLGIDALGRVLVVVYAWREANGFVSSRREGRLRTNDDSMGRSREEGIRF